MVRLFDTSFWFGTLLVGAALVVALAALSSTTIPIVGTGRGALLTVAVLGVVACTVGGVGQAPSLGWTSPVTIFGAITGMLAALVIVAGLAGWAPILEPVAGLVPGAATGGVTDTVRVAIFALAALVGVKWLVALGLAVYERLT